MNEVTTESIAQLIHAGSERQELDFKKTFYLGADNKKEKAELTKDIIALANFGGGLIVGGVDDQNGQFIPVGMAEVELSRFDSTLINDFVKQYCDPPINTVTRVDEIDGKKFGVILVPGFFEQPHIVTKEYQGVIYQGDLLVRSTSNNSVRVNAHELRKLLEVSVSRRQIMLGNMLQAALKASPPLLVNKEVELDADQSLFNSKVHLDAYGAFRIVSVQAPNLGIFFRLPKLKDAVEKSSVTDKYGSRDFPNFKLFYQKEKRLSSGIVLTHQDTDELLFNYFGLSGSVFCAESVLEDRHYRSRNVDNKNISVGLLKTFNTIFCSIIFAHRYMKLLTQSHDIVVNFSLESVKPCELVMDSNKFRFGWTPHINSMELPISIKGVARATSELPELERVASEMFCELCWYFHLDLTDEMLNSFLNTVKSDLTV